MTLLLGLIPLPDIESRELEMLRAVEEAVALASELRLRFQGRYPQRRQVPLRPACSRQACRRRGIEPLLIANASH